MPQVVWTAPAILIPIKSSKALDEFGLTSCQLPLSACEIGEFQSNQGTNLELMVLRAAVGCFAGRLYARNIESMGQQI